MKFWISIKDFVIFLIYLIKANAFLFRNDCLSTLETYEWNLAIIRSTVDFMGWANIAPW